jgi:hypothetical protein
LGVITTTVTTTAPLLNLIQSERKVKIKWWSLITGTLSLTSSSNNQSQ